MWCIWGIWFDVCGLFMNLWFVCCCGMGCLFSFVWVDLVLCIGSLCSFLVWNRMMLLLVWGCWVWCCLDMWYFVCWMYWFVVWSLCWLIGLWLIGMRRLVIVFGFLCRFMMLWCWILLCFLCDNFLFFCCWFVWWSCWWLRLMLVCCMYRLCLMCCFLCICLFVWCLLLLGWWISSLIGFGCLFVWGMCWYWLVGLLLYMCRWWMNCYFCDRDCCMWVVFCSGSCLFFVCWLYWWRMLCWLVLFVIGMCRFVWCCCLWRLIVFCYCL